MKQIFKQNIPSDFLFEFLKDNSSLEANYFIFNSEIYKKSILNNSLNSFIQKCKPYYYISKQFYLERELNYNNFITIIRQICKANNIKYKSNIKYDKSNYSIVYYIYQTNDIL
jgi:hypothetical protein